MPLDIIVSIFCVVFGLLFCGLLLGISKSGSIDLFCFTAAFVALVGLINILRQLP